ncbi:MAG: C-terminal target protein [Candidatus Saccharibacteria bacterium]|nr:C-terminal target protein [Candidatus Saccharibacteria bacterium]
MPRSSITKHSALRKNRGFTLVEMLVIAPIIILAITAFIAAIITVTGDVLATRSANALSRDVQDSFNRMEKDVIHSRRFLSYNLIAAAAPQGLDEQAYQFLNVGGNGTGLILETPATTANPDSTSAKYVRYADAPFDCSDSRSDGNDIMYLNIIYYIWKGVLFRRTIMPTNYATAGCSTPWQQPSCAPGVTGGVCVTGDTILIKKIFPNQLTFKYFPTPSSTAEITTASDPTQLASTRLIALAGAKTVQIDFNIKQPVAGRDIKQTATLRATIPLDSYVTSVPTIAGTTQPTEPSPKAWWTFNGNVNDSSGNNYTGTVTGATLTAGQNGTASSAYTFNGTSNFITIPNGSLISGNGSYAVSSWIKPTVYSNTAGVAGWGTWGTTNATTAIRMTTGGVLHYWWGNDLNYNNDTLLGSWHHVVAQFDGTTRTTYVDGVLAASDTPTGHNAAAANGTIGRTNNTEYFNGSIDDVRIYTQALTPAQITTLFQQGAK